MRLPPLIASCHEAISGGIFFLRLNSGLRVYVSHGNVSTAAYGLRSCVMLQLIEKVNVSNEQEMTQSEVPLQTPRSRKK